MDTIDRTAPEDWALVRDVRLRALADSPGAFASTHARERCWDEDHWRRFVRGGAWFLAGPDRGIAGGVPEPGEPTCRHLVGMWVAPDARGTGVADSLLTAVRTWAFDDGAAALTLWVADSAVRARRLYERSGFRPTGARQPLPSDPTVGEAHLRLDLR